MKVVLQTYLLDYQIILLSHILKLPEGRSIDATSFVKRYINPIKLYKNQYPFVYAKNYKGIIISNYRK